MSLRLEKIFLVGDFLWTDSIWRKKIITRGEGAKIVGLFKNPSTGKEIIVSGVKYGIIKVDSRTIIAMNATGVIAVKTSQLIVLGTYSSTMQPSKASLPVEKMGDYFRDVGY